MLYCSTRTLVCTHQHKMSLMTPSNDPEQEDASWALSRVLRVHPWQLDKWRKTESRYISTMSDHCSLSFFFQRTLPLQALLSDMVSWYIACCAGKWWWMSQAPLANCSWTPSCDNSTFEYRYEPSCLSTGWLNLLSKEDEKFDHVFNNPFWKHGKVFRNIFWKG